MISSEHIQAALDNVAASIERNSAELGAVISGLIAAGAGDLDWQIESRGRYATTDGRYRIAWHGAANYSLTRHGDNEPNGYVYIRNAATQKDCFRTVKDAKAAAATDAASNEVSS